MLKLLDRTVGAHVVRVVATDRTDGDMHPERVDPADLAVRQRRIAGRTWPMLDQVHGVAVIAFDRATIAPSGPRPALAVGDVALTDAGGPPVAVWAADCAPVALVGSGATIAVVHAGWRGVAAGVLTAGVNSISSRGESVVAAVLGPVIRPCCYEFRSDDIVVVADALQVEPTAITGRTTWGTAALDVPAAVQLALSRHRIALRDRAPCTGCDTRWYSHRRRRDLGRHAVVAWSEER